MSDAEDATLDQWGFAAVPAPSIRREVIVRSPTKGKIAGFLGRETGRGEGTIVYTTLRSDYHYYREGGGWAISDSILDGLEQRGVGRILIHDGTTADDDVYEFSARRYYEDAEPVTSGHLETDTDPQSYVPEDTVMHEWAGHAADLFHQDFERAVNRIGDKRGWD